MDKTRNAPPKDRKAPPKDFLSPPEWWRKWRPLRWLAGGAVLISLAMLGRSLIEGDSSAAPDPVADLEPVKQEPQLPTAEELAATAPLPEIAPAAEAAATPAPPPPAPAPVPIVKPAAVTPPPPTAPTQVAMSAPQSTATAPQATVIESLPAPQQVSDYEAFTRTESSRLDFMGEFRSYDSVDESFAKLQKAGYEPAITSNHRKVPEEFPPYHLDRIDVKKYQHLGQPGKLAMQFFNDRLFEVEFEPEDAGRYHDAFRRKYPGLRPNKIGRAELLSGYLRMASSLDLAVSDVGKTLRTRPFALWQDRRLVVQRDGWDARYARELAH